jgi:alpha-tubulin suppressor-like RCC1 family protein
MSGEDSKCYFCGGEANKWDYLDGGLRIECSGCKRKYELSSDVRDHRMDDEESQLFCEEQWTNNKIPLTEKQTQRLTIYIDMNPKNEDFVNFDLDLYDILIKEF